MEARDYQLDMADQGFDILSKYGLTYLSAQERVGKTITAIIIAERCKNIANVLVLTKRKAVVGWEETLAAFAHNKNYEVTTYQMLHKVAQKPDLIILDEAHAYLTAMPKPSKTQKAVRVLATKLPLIYVSATPHAQGYHQLFHQLQVSSFSPWRKFSTFYAWFRAYGKPKTIQVHGKTLNVYTEMQDDACRVGVDHLFVTRTRASLGFPHEPNDTVHFVELAADTRERYNRLMRDKLLEAEPLEESFLADSSMKLRATLHMLEGGVMKWSFIGGNIAQGAIDSALGNVQHCHVETSTVDEAMLTVAYLVLDNTEKVEYIKRTWGDTEQMVIFYQYKAELLKLKSHFKYAQILQGTAYAEGVELSHIDTCIVYSMDWSTAKYVQRRARQAGFDRDKAINVHYLLTRGAVSEQVYTTVSTNKRNFVDSTFEEHIL